MSACPSLRPAVLQLGRLPGQLEPWLAERYAVHRLADEGEPEAFLDRRGGEFVAVATSAFTGISAAQMDLLPRLQVISSFGVGLDRIDVAAARARGVAVGYTPDILNDCVADTALALLLAVARRLPEADRYVRAGQWEARGINSFPLGRKVSGARLGILGLGRIGRTIARRAAGFDMDIRYHSRRPVAEAPWAHVPDLLELARWADYLVVATTGGPQTRHLVDGAVLAALGPRGYLVNIARGSVVDEAALVAALQSGQLAGAGLDVFADEPRVPAALKALDSVVLLPHVASGTEETREAMARRVVDNLERFFRDGSLISAVD